MEKNEEVELSDQIITDRLNPHLLPEESELYYAYGQHSASAGTQAILLVVLGFLFGSLFLIKNVFIGLTNERLMLLHVSSTYEEKSFESIMLSEIESVKIKEQGFDTYINIRTHKGEKYEIKAEKGLSLVEKQRENLEKICQRLTEPVER